MSTFTLGYFKYICIYLSIILNAGLGEKLYVVAAFTEVKDLSVSYPSGVKFERHLQGRELRPSRFYFLLSFLFVTQI